MATQPDITIAPPCIEIAPLGALPQIPLLGGAQLNAFIDIAGGTPTDCKLKFNLLLQLGPLFASMACLFKILNVISALKNFVSAASDPMKLPSAVPAMLDAIAQLETCIPALQIPNLIAMIKHILLLIIGFVECVLEQIDSVLKFKLTLDFDGAQGNPTLLRALQCASDSADASLGNTMSALQPLQFLMTVVTMIAGITGSSINLPDFSTVSTDIAEIESTVASLESAMQALQSVVELLPGISMANNNSNDTRAFLGIGWKFPFQVDASGRIAQSRAEQRIEEAIYLILSTAKGERPMLPGFGCGIHDLVFAPDNAATLAQVVQSVRAALTTYERRIDVLDVSADNSVPAGNLLVIRVSYRIRSNNAVGNLVYPFYLQESS